MKGAGWLWCAPRSPRRRLGRLGSWGWGRELGSRGIGALGCGVSFLGRVFSGTWSVVSFWGRVIYDTSPAQACVFLAEGVILEKCTWLVSTACIFDVFVARRASFGLVFFGLVWFVCFLYFFCKQLISLPPHFSGVLAITNINPPSTVQVFLYLYPCTVHKGAV